MAIAKKQLPRAVDRNALRRVMREAWRAARPDPTLSVFVRLTRASPAWREVGARARKRAWRTEFDELLASLRSVASTRPSRRVTPSQES